MFIHSVFFWLREDLSEREQANFRQGAFSLSAIETVHQGFVGTPASTDRPIIDRSYSYALILVFKDKDAHDAYQAHATHDQFRRRFSSHWNKVLIYDSETL